MPRRLRGLSSSSTVRRVQSIPYARHQIHALVEHCKDEWAVVLALKEEDVVMFAAGDEQLMAVFEKLSCTCIPSADRHEMTLQRGFVSVGLRRVPGCDGVDRDFEQVEFRGRRELVLTHPACDRPACDARLERFR